MIRCRRTLQAALGAVVLVAASAAAQAPNLEGLDFVLKAAPDGPVARVNGVDIDKDEFSALYTQQIASLERQANKHIPDHVRLDTGLACIRMLIQRELLLQEAAKKKVEVPEDDLDKRWKAEMMRMKAAYAAQSGKKDPSEEEVLAAAGASRDSARAELKKALVVEKMRTIIAEQQKMTVDENEIKKFFDEHGSQFKQLDTIHLNQVFVAFKPTGKPEDDQKKTQAKAKIEDALSRIHAGESFAAVAKAVSESPDKARGGDLGALPTTMVPPFYLEAAKKLKQNEISGVIESEYGFHIIKLIDSEGGGEVTFEEAKPRIKQMLLAQKAGQAVETWCEDFMKKPGAVQVFLQIDRILATHPELAEMAQKALAPAQAPAQPPAAKENTPKKK